MSFAPQIKILATYMRGGTSKGVFFRLQDLPEPAQQPGRARVRFGHSSGVLGVGAEARYIDGQWVVTKALMSRSARVLMEGWVAVPG
jgi:2-methylaconitate cis-trans-isomerase PrpF